MGRGRGGSAGHVLVADADAVARGEVSAALRGAGFEVRQLTSGREVLEAARVERPHGVVLEVDLPGTCGYEVCWTLRDELGPSLPIVFLSADRAEPRDRVAGLLIGADDYLAKPCDAGELVARLRGVLRRAASAPRPAEHDLTARELDVVRLVAQGLDPRTIAAELVISPKTVESHLENVYRKIGARSRAQVVAYAYRHELVEGDEPLAGAR